MEKPRYIGKVLLTVISIVIVGGVTLPFYLNHAAEKGAQEFCNSIAINSNMSDAALKFTETGGNEMHHIGSGEEQGFIFPGFAFDTAECDVSANKEGKVVSKKSYMRDD